ncbi:hypothetical protein R3P38DRAFT_3217993 [Favolaschia claudopus]|uniref:Uncharacterized protein n=1 Tax=Favolaschia claudopus TaxID=2862362 RepID=A0AAW0A5I8_9AGAR
MAEPDLFFCSGCNHHKTRADFGTKSNGQRTATCQACTRRTREAKQKKAREKENADPSRTPVDPDAGKTLSMDAFLLRVVAVAAADAALASADGKSESIELEKHVDTSALAGNEREKADKLVAAIWEQIKYRFVQKHLDSGATRFMYHCSQNKDRQHAPKKKEGVKNRDKIQMDAFDCHGWVHVTVLSGQNTSRVKVSHHDDHIPYYCIDIPADIQEFIRANLKLNPSQLWDEILKKHPQPVFSRQAAIALWRSNDAKEWNEIPDELKICKDSTRRV